MSYLIQSETVFVCRKHVQRGGKEKLIVFKVSAEKQQIVGQCKVPLKFPHSQLGFSENFIFETTNQQKTIQYEMDYFQLRIKQQSELEIKGLIPNKIHHNSFSFVSVIKEFLVPQ